MGQQAEPDFVDVCKGISRWRSDLQARNLDQWPAWVARPLQSHAEALCAQELETLMEQATTDGAVCKHTNLSEKNAVCFDEIGNRNYALQIGRFIFCVQPYEEIIEA